MAHSLANVAKFGPHVRTELIDEASLSTPEFSVLPWKSVPGYTYSTLVRSANPVVSFRDVNEGIAATNGTYTNRTVTCKILNPRWECDKAIADACIDGAEAFIAKEALATMSGAVLTAAKQLWYGTGNDAKGFAGLASQVDASMLSNNSGDTSNGCSSVYIVAANTPDYLAWVLGGDGAFDISEVRLADIADGSNNRYAAYVQDGTFWVGCQLGHAKAVARLANIDSDHGIDDDDIYDLLAKFPAGVKPSHIFMNRSNLNVLRKSRTATNVTGSPAPTPTEVEGIPIVVTEALVNTEAVVSFSS